VSDPVLRLVRNRSLQEPYGSGTGERKGSAMTVPHETRALAPASMPAAITTLRVRGLRVSAARRLVLEALFAADGPVTAETIAAGLDGRFPCSDLASVYRNLDTLEEVGLVRHVHLGHGPGLYSLAGADTEFVTCERCGAYEAVEPSRLGAAKDAIERELGYRPRFTHFPIVGVCATCQEEEDR
jgi:Fur family transcriptional regulator, ferric uptake regulator